MTNDDYFIYRLTGTLEGISNCIRITSEVKDHKCITCEGSKRLIDDLILELREIIKEENG